MGADKITSLEPRLVWDFFSGLSAIPRPSKKEEKIRAHVLKVVADHGLKAREDAIGNIVVDVPASSGCESAPLLVLQAHVDMVCEKNNDTRHDFDNDPIKLILDKDKKQETIVRADGTTLGADNGMGVALALAAACDRDVVHPPMELLFTVDEEAGMGGAKALKPDSVRGRVLLNLDSEEDDALYVGCAGGADTNLTWKLKTTPPDAGSITVEIVVTGLDGGHSGSDINLNRGNANKLLARTVMSSGATSMRLVTCTGGSKRNAIPREATATFTINSDDLPALEKAAAQIAADGAAESGETALTITVRKAADATVAASVDDTVRVLRAIQAIPNGVVEMSVAVPGLVQTSNNVSTIVCNATSDTLTVDLGTLTRSSSETRKQVLLDQIGAIGRLAGAAVEITNTYPGWQPDMDSKLLARAKEVYKRLFNKEPVIAAIHAGLECGIIGERVGQMEMISYGPRIEGAHSPNERVYVDSVQKAWNYLQTLLAELARA